MLLGDNQSGVNTKVALIQLATSTYRIDLPLSLQERVLNKSKHKRTTICNVKSLLLVKHFPEAIVTKFVQFVHRQRNKS